jgi:hypothetical protein
VAATRAIDIIQNDTPTKSSDFRTVPEAANAFEGTRRAHSASSEVLPTIVFMGFFICGLMFFDGIFMAKFCKKIYRKVSIFAQMERLDFAKISVTKALSMRVFRYLLILPAIISQLILYRETHLWSQFASLVYFEVGKSSV